MKSEGVEQNMSDQELINEMVAVYRDLNMRLRGADLNAIADKKADSGEDLKTILGRMRDREYNSSQAIKIMSMGDDASGIDEDRRAEVLDELIATGITPMILLSQYGTAREATLSLIRGLSDEAWDQEYESPRGRMSIREYCRALVNADREDEKLLNQLVEKTAA